MDKAFDLKDLGEKLKDRGLDLAEDAAKIVVEEVIAWTKASVALTENKYDDMLLAAFPLIEGAINEALDKIDGKVG